MKNIVPGLIAAAGRRMRYPKYRAAWGRALALLLLLAVLAQGQAARAEASLPQTDQTPLSPLTTSPALPAQPDYISGFSLGPDNAYAIFYEERTVACPGPDTYRIYTNLTLTGPYGFSTTPTATNICDSHFIAEAWPITIGATTYSYRAWGASHPGYTGQHNFYVSNDRVNWTLAGTFTFPDPFGDQILYGFHDLVQINGHYLGFAESAGGHTFIVSSTTGDQNNWTVVALVAGIPRLLPPQDHLIVPGTNGPIPTGDFVLMQVGGQLAYAKLYVPADRSAAYMMINTAAAQAATPALAEAAFLNVNNWTWADGSIGAATAANAVLTSTQTGTSGHNLREVWTAPMSDPASDHVIIYVGQYNFAAGTRRALGCAADSAQCLVVAVPAAPTPAASTAPIRAAIPATGFPAGQISVLPAQPADKAYADSDMQIEILALKIRVPIVGVPLVNNAWDVTWLGNEAGYLQGTAFPTWPGNSAIVGHAYDADGKPGPFSDMARLHYGDPVYLHAWGQKYVYQVRENRLTTANDQTVFKHEVYSWVTLLTCQGYDDANKTYKWRRAVRAILTNVVSEP